MRKNGFTIGQAELIYGSSVGAGQTHAKSTDTSGDGKIHFGSVLVMDDIRVGVTNFDVNFSTGVAAFNGSIFVATGGATLFPNGSVGATVTHRSSAPDAEALRVDMKFDKGRVKGLVFKADTLNLRLGSFLTVTAKDFYIDTSATGSQIVVSFASAGATVKFGSMTIGGSARNFGFTAAWVSP